MDVADNASAERVKLAIETELSPNSSQEDRKAACELIDDLKNNSPQCAIIGLTLYANYENSNEVRYIGLRLVEDYIKKQWNGLQRKDKDTWKEEVFFLMAAVKVSELNHIKEALARLAVEIAKREFPQNWSTFLPDLDTLHMKGPAQLEVTLLVFLRLAEDVVLLLDPHIQTQRRKNIEQALNENMSDIFAFFIKTLQTNVGAWRGSHEQINLRLSEATLFALGIYMTHASLEHVFAKNAILLQMMCELLSEEKLRMAAADCLLALVERRRDRVDVRSPILILFSDDAMSLLAEVARKVSSAGPVEDEYNFLKKICDIIVNLGCCQLTDIWGHDRGIRERPGTFAKYLELLLGMVRHPSQVLCLKALAAFSAFLKHENISKDDVFIDFIPHFVPEFRDKLPKFGEIDKSNHPSCDYSAMDHESSSEYMDSFSKLRSILCICIRDCTTLLPIHCFEQVCLSIMNLVQKPEHQQNLILWDALAVFAEAVLARFWISEVNDVPSNVIIERGKSVDVIAMSNEILRSLIHLKVETPQVASDMLLCIQAFFPFFKKSQENLIATLEKIMSTFSQFPLEESNKEILSTRRQATSCFLNLCKEDAAHLLPYLESFKEFVSKREECNEIRALEYHTLLEGLLILNNSLPVNREEFISLQLSRIDSLISTENFKKSLESTENFVNFLGFGDTNWREPQSKDNRHHLTSFLGILFAIVKRVQLTDSEKSLSSTSGSFLGSSEPSWIRRLVGYISVLTQVIKHSGCMWTQEVQTKINDCFIPAFQLNENDRAFLLGQHISKEIKGSLEVPSFDATRASMYIHNLHTQSYSLLGHFGGFLGDILYSLDGLADHLISNVMFSWPCLPKYRFVTVFKSFFKPFLSSCPTSCFTKAIAPVLSVALNSMFELLKKEWANYKERGTGSKNQSPENLENPSDQVIEERLVYTLSREYIEMLVSCFFIKNKGKDESVSGEEATTPEPGDLGNFILQCESTNTYYIFTMFTALTWPDTVVVNKIARVIPHIIKYISTNTSETRIDSSIIDQLFIFIIKGLETHGAEISAQGSLITVALNMYLSLRIAYPSLVRVMLMLPSCKEGKLKKFDLDVFEAECNLTDKKKRECFRSFLSASFGRNLSETYKSEIKIKDLPPLAPRAKPKPLQETDTLSITDLFE